MFQVQEESTKDLKELREKQETIAANVGQRQEEGLLGTIEDEKTQLVGSDLDVRSPIIPWQPVRNIVMFHGINADTLAWRPSLYSFCDKLGIPRSFQEHQGLCNKANYEEWYMQNEVLLMKTASHSITPNTMVVGHSLGNLDLIKTIVNFGIPIKKAVFVAPFLGEIPNEDASKITDYINRTIRGSFTISDEEIERFKELCPERTVICCDDDLTLNRPSQVRPGEKSVMEQFAEKLECQSVIKTPTGGHYGAGTGVLDIAEIGLDKEIRKYYNSTQEIIDEAYHYTMTITDPEHPVTVVDGEIQDKLFPTGTTIRHFDVDGFEPYMNKTDIMYMGVSKGKGNITINADYNTFEIYEGEMLAIYPGDMVQLSSQDGQEIGLNVLTIPNVVKGKNAWLGDNHIFNDHSQEIKFRNVAPEGIKPVYSTVESEPTVGEDYTK